MSTKTKDPWEILRRPFKWEEIEVKPMQVFTSDGKPPMAKAAPYFDARSVGNRLDEAFGPWGWSVTLRDVTVSHDGKVHGAVIARLEVNDGEHTVVREELCEPTDIEPMKGAASGALKRCFSVLGNRMLYEVDLGWCPCELNSKGKFGKWTPLGKAQMKERYEKAIAGLSLDRSEDMEAAPQVAPQTPVSGPLNSQEPSKLTMEKAKTAGGYLVHKCHMNPEQFAAFKVRHGDDWADEALHWQFLGVTDLESIVSFSADAWDDQETLKRTAVEGAELAAAIAKEDGKHVAAVVAQAPLEK